MFVIRTLFTENQIVFRLFLYISAILFLPSSVQAAPIENTTALSLITTTHLNKTPQLSYRISSTSKGITATPALKGVPSVSISRSSGVNHSIQINGEEHFVTTSPTNDGKGLIVQTQASNGTSAHLLKVYPVQPSGQSHSFYVEDESSGATFLATTNATDPEISLQQTGNKTTDDDCDGSYKVQGKCQSLPAYAVPVIIVGTIFLTFATVITSFFCCECCRSSSGGTGGSTFFALGLFGDGGAGGGCE